MPFVSLIAARALRTGWASGPSGTVGACRWPASPAGRTSRGSMFSLSEPSSRLRITRCASGGGESGPVTWPGTTAPVRSMRSIRPTSVR